MPNELPEFISNTSGNLTSTLTVEPKNLYSNVTGSGAGHIAFDANLQAQLDSVASVRADIIDYIRLRLGYGMIDVEADQEHFEMGIKQAFNRYRQRSSNAVEESYVFLDVYPETQEYILPNYIIDVKQIFRRGIGSVTGTTASQFEPFASGYLNTYMLVAGRIGGLAQYELFTGYQELAMKMFGGFMNFTWNKVTKKLTIVRKIPWGGIQGPDIVKESVLLWTYNYKPDQILLNDPQAFPWIQDYAYALTSISIGQAREKFATIAGPQGGTTLNGTALKQEGLALLDKLDEEIKLYIDGGQPMWWVTG
tara:strand:+ start:1901 stop:2824 length:924 start_codon:yes stop_codon:yes gene_type:complete